MTALTPEAVGASLTKAQRKLILHHNAGFQRLAPPGEGRGTGAAYMVAVKLNPDLFEQKWGGDCYRWRLTPLGLAVRATLLSKDPAP